MWLADLSGTPMRWLRGLGASVASRLCVASRPGAGRRLCHKHRVAHRLAAPVSQGGECLALPDSCIQSDGGCHFGVSLGAASRMPALHFFDGLEQILFELRQFLVFDIDGLLLQLRQGSGGNVVEPGLHVDPQQHQISLFVAVETIHPVASAHAGADPTDLA